LPDAETILEGAKKVFDQFPYGKIKDELEEQSIEGLDSIQLLEIQQIEELEAEKEAQENWEMIKKDFPTHTEDELKNNIDLIDEYYAQNIDYVVLNEIANNGQEIENKVAQRASQKSSVDRAWCILTNYQSPWNFFSSSGF